jgi:hypothetical protein
MRRTRHTARPDRQSVFLWLQLKYQYLYVTIRALPINQP